MPDLAYANVFAQKLQPLAYSGYVPGQLPAKDGYAQQSDWSRYDNFAYLMMYPLACQ